MTFRLLLPAVAAGLAMGQTPLPEAPGKAVTERMCKPCHGLENVIRRKYTKDKWADVVEEMIARGAKGSDEDIDQVIDYLASHFGPATPAKKSQPQH